MRSAPTTTAFTSPRAIMWPAMLSAIRVVGIPSCISSQAVRRAPWRWGRESRNARRGSCGCARWAPSLGRATPGGRGAAGAPPPLGSRERPGWPCSGWRPPLRRAAGTAGTPARRAGGAGRSSPRRRLPRPRSEPREPPIARTTDRIPVPRGPGTAFASKGEEGTSAGNRHWRDPLEWSRGGDAGIPVERALEIVLANTPSLPSKEVLLTQALGRVLAEDVPSDVDMPPFDRSAMDGYALRAGDTSGAPVVLDVIGQVRAGQYPDRGIEPGKAIQVMTGAPVPPGATAVQPVE